MSEGEERIVKREDERKYKEWRGGGGLENEKRREERKRSEKECRIWMGKAIGRRDK